MTWKEALNLLIPGIPAVLLLLLALSTIKTRIHIHINGQPDQKKYHIYFENLDDVASLDTARLELRIRGQGAFQHKCSQLLGFSPWPATFTETFKERTAVLTAEGLGRGERWHFEVYTEGGEQGVEVKCSIGHRELPIISSDATSEYSDNTNSSPLNIWLGLPLATLLYLFVTIGMRLWQERTPLFQWLDVVGTALVILGGLFSYWFMLKPRQTVVAFPITRPAFPHSSQTAKQCPPPDTSKTSRFQRIWKMRRR